MHYFIWFSLSRALGEILLARFFHTRNPRHREISASSAKSTSTWLSVHQDMMLKHCRGRALLRKVSGKNVFGNFWQMGKGYFSGHRFRKWFEYSPGFRIKELKRNKVVRFPASDRFIQKTNQMQSSNAECWLNNFMWVPGCICKGKGPPCISRSHGEGIWLTEVTVTW